MQRYIKLSLVAILMMLSATEADAWTWWWNRHKDEVMTRHVTAKREFRGVWLQTVFQDRYMRKTSAQNQTYLTQLITRLKADGFNAVIFQVRPEGDAFYHSELEPWSRFLTGKQGQAPREDWDPMAFLIDLCHQNHIEFHAWINPYRMGASKGRKMEHPLWLEHPEWFVQYGGKWYLNPGIPESRAYIRAVVSDIVSRYDIDAIHMDDYFYPYPEGGETFNDGPEFMTYAPQMKLDFNHPDALGDFRRRNVDILIKYIHQDIRKLKPWVRFGVSPFGIYRNKAAWADGSDTHGLQCYDDLYADVLRWARSGWIDYVVPQLYWEIGHRQADFTTLARWWNDHIPSSCQLFVGISIERSLDQPKDAVPASDLRASHVQFMRKIELCRTLDEVDGECFWYGYQVEDNAWHVADFLRENVYQAPALTPAFTTGNATHPERVENLRVQVDGSSVTLTWKAADSPDPVTYLVYKFPGGTKANTDNPAHLICRTSATTLQDTDVENGKYTYVVSVTDRYGRESAGEKVKVKVKNAE